MTQKKEKSANSGATAPTRKRQAPAKTLEGREKQLIAKAYDLAEKQIDDGSASSQVLTNFLKLGSRQAELELEKLRQENVLLAAKAEAIKSQKKQEELYAAALEAMKSYSGQGNSKGGNNG